MMHTKSRYSEHCLKNGKVHSTEKKGQRGFCDGLGLLLGGKSRGFLSLCCEIGECKGVPQVAGVPCPSGTVQCVNDTIGDAVSQQDNAPVHIASVVTEWFEQQNIQVDEHPPYSPDLAVYGEKEFSGHLAITAQAGSR